MAFACNAQFTDGDFESEAMPGNRDWFREEPTFSIADASTERFVETRPCLCFKGGKFLKKLWCCVGGSITR